MEERGVPDAFSLRDSCPFGGVRSPWDRRARTLLPRMNCRSTSSPSLSPRLRGRDHLPPCAGEEEGRAAEDYLRPGSRSRSRHKARKGPDSLILGDKEDKGAQREGLGSPLWDGETSLLPGRGGGQLSLFFTASRLDDPSYKSNTREGLGVPRPDDFPRCALHMHSIPFQSPSWGITFFKHSQAAIASPPPPPRLTEQCIFTPRITCPHPKASSTLFLLSLSY